MMNLVFKSIPRIERFYRDLKKAGIPLQDGQGRKAVFHSLASHLRDQFGAWRGGLVALQWL
jgi:hypothetical protein